MSLPVAGEGTDAYVFGEINVTEGTKGGRGREIDRWVAITDRARRALITAAAIQGSGRNLIPRTLAFSAWKDHTTLGVRPPHPKTCAPPMPAIVTNLTGCRHRPLPANAWRAKTRIRAHGISSPRS